jgi:flagellar assembly factor FliW
MVLVEVAVGEGTERVEVPEQEIFRFPTGVAGYEDLTRFAIFELDSQLFLLQAVDDVEVSFVLVDPFLLDPEYRAVAREDCQVLDLDEKDEYWMLCIVTLAPNGRPMTVNFRAPIILNSTKKLGMQMILQEDRQIRQPIVLRDGALYLEQEPAARGGRARVGGAAVGAHRADRC